MMKNKRVIRSRNQLTSFVMTAILVFVACVGNTTMAKAYETSYTLAAEVGCALSGTTQANSDGNVEISFAKLADIQTQSDMNNAKLTSLRVTFKVSAYTPSLDSSKTAGVQSFAMSTDWSNSWTSGSWCNLSLGTTQTTTLDLSTIKWGESTTIGKFGIQFANLEPETNFTYEIMEAKLVSGDTTSGGNSGGADDSYTGSLTYTVPDTFTDDAVSTPLKQHGRLHVDMDSLKLSDQNNEMFQLRGVSTHGLNWDDVGLPYVNIDSLKRARDVLGANAVRLACYTTEYYGYADGGTALNYHTQDYIKSDMKYRVDKGVKCATALGMYAIVDWHILHDLTPQAYKEQAKEYFTYMSQQYKDYDNIIYEICNEPNGQTTWSDIKSYAEEIIPMIRANDADAIIIVGTPTWSQDVDVADDNPLKDSDGTLMDNVMYTIHFYANTHGSAYREKVVNAVNNIPIFCTEFGMCDSTGGGSNNFDEAGRWLDYFDEQNISYFVWSLCAKSETSSLLTGANRQSWTEADLSESGQWIKQQYTAREAKETYKGGTQSGGNESGGTQPGGTESGGTESGGTQSGGTESGGTQSGDTGSGSGTGSTAGIGNHSGDAGSGAGNADTGNTDGGNGSVGGETGDAAGNMQGAANDNQTADTIKVTGLSKKIAAGKRVKLTASVSPENAANKQVIWTTSNKKYATVSKTGVVTTKKAGAGKKVTITATAADGSGVKQTYKLSIMKKAVKKISIKTDTKKVKVGRKLKLKTVVSPTKNVNKTVTWKSSNTKIATVDQKGNVKALKAGIVKVTATATDGSGKKTTIRIRVTK